jgi:hypothetical protein
MATRYFSMAFTVSSGSHISFSYTRLAFSPAYTSNQAMRLVPP